MNNKKIPPYPGQRVRLWEVQYAPGDSGDGGIALFRVRNAFTPPAYLIYLIRLGCCLWISIHEITVDVDESWSFTAWYIAVKEDQEYTKSHPGFW